MGSRSPRAMARPLAADDRPPGRARDLYVNLRLSTVCNVTETTMINP